MFKKVKCPECGEFKEGLQITEGQRRWLDIVKDSTLAHMAHIQTLPEAEQLSPDNQGWYTIAEAFLFTYGYMVSREDKKDS
jgi:hypothetical protein